MHAVFADFERQTPAAPHALDAMAPKRTQDAYAQKDAALPDVRPNDFQEIGQFWASFHEIATIRALYTKPSHDLS